MEQLQLNSSKLLDSDSPDSKSPGAWLNNFAGNVWQHPKDHLAEIGTAVLLTAGATVGGAFAARRLLAELEGPAASSAKTIGADLTRKAAAAESSAETFTKMSDKSVGDAVNMLKDRYSLGVSSWGTTTIQGSERPGINILRSSDLAALELKQNGNTFYAHKISITNGSDVIASYYTREPFNLKNPWVADEQNAWPLGAGGPVDGLKQAGIHIMDMTKPRGFHVNPQANSLAIKWFDMRVLTDPALKAPGSFVPETASSIAGNSKIFSEIEIAGPNAVTRGHGLVALRSEEGRAFHLSFDPAAETAAKLPD